MLDPPDGGTGGASGLLTNSVCLLGRRLQSLLAIPVNNRDGLPVVAVDQEGDALVAVHLRHCIYGTLEPLYSGVRVANVISSRVRALFPLRYGLGLC
jgi:hypothetical protein